MKVGHEEFLRDTLAANFMQADYLVTAGKKEFDAAQRAVPTNQIYPFNQNTTSFSAFLQSKCKMVVSMALHGTIYAVRLGIPAFGLKAGKIEGALRHFGGDELVRACSTSTVVPSLAALVRCHKKYDALRTFQRIADAQETFARFLRDADRAMLTAEDLSTRLLRITNH